MSAESSEALDVAKRVIDVLDDLGVPYHVGGSYASSVHGIPRQTRDIDLVVDLAESVIEAFASRLAPEFYLDAHAARRAIRTHDTFNLIHRATAFKVDVFVRGNSPFDLQEFARAEVVLIGEGAGPRIRVKSAEDTLLRKLAWYRDGGEVSDRQWGDAQGIARTQGARLDRDYLSRWAATLGVDDLLARLLQGT